MTEEELEKENMELKEKINMLRQGYVWQDYDPGEGCYEDTHEGKWVKRWKQQDLRQVLRAEAEEGFKRITYPIYDKELYRQAYFAAAEPREEKIAVLEKENAELKEQNIKDCENFNKTMSETKKQWNKEHYQLAKATEIIKDLLLMAKVEHLERNYESVDEAEQFLGEVKE